VITLATTALAGWGLSELRAWLSRRDARQKRTDRAALVHRLDGESWPDLMRRVLVTVPPGGTRPGVRQALEWHFAALDNALKLRDEPVLSAGERSRIGGSRGRELEAGNGS